MPARPFETLYRFLSAVVPGHDAAWDAGTGNGQCATALAKYFALVHATDPSAEQIERAIRRPNIIYFVRPAEESGLPDHSVDLVTAAQAAHWFDFSRFVLEGSQGSSNRRRHRDLGLFVPYSPDAPLNAIMREFGEGILRDYWPPQNRLLWNGYADLSFPFEAIAHPPFEMTVEWDLEQLCGYYTSWSATQKFIQANHYHPLRDVRERFGISLGSARRS